MRFGEDRVAFIKILASVVSIGSEGSVGRKGPIVQVGSSIGITIGPAFKFSRAWQKNLLLN
jgi:CIC family chloride channel protein